MFEFDHVALSVSNADKSIEFYKKLGFKFDKRYDAPDKSLSIVLLKNENMILELFCYKNYNELPKHCEDLAEDLVVLGTKHFGLAVEDVKTAAEFVTKNGICKSLPKIQTGRLGRDYFFITDPDGILVEIIQKD